MSRPQVIDDQEHERVHDRVAAIDVAKDSGMVCTRTPHPSRPGARRSTVWTVKARMGAVRALGRQLARGRHRDGDAGVYQRTTCEVRVHEFKWEAPLEARLRPVA